MTQECPGADPRGVAIHRHREKEGDDCPKERGKAGRGAKRGVANRGGAVQRPDTNLKMRQTFLPDDDGSAEAMD